MINGPLGKQDWMIFCPEVKAIRVPLIHAHYEILHFLLLSFALIIETPESEDTCSDYRFRRALIHHCGGDAGGISPQRDLCCHPVDMFLIYPVS